MQYPMYLIILMWRNAWPIKKSDTDVLYHCNINLHERSSFHGKADGDHLVSVLFCVNELHPV